MKVIINVVENSPHFSISFIANTLWTAERSIFQHQDIPIVSITHLYNKVMTFRLLYISGKFISKIFFAFG